mmetsp:Transcript_37483/g.94722  ORF Transcript_37483/g.94722 Transcript_37483/m.94722 type:complete len:281 (-) Transcript_37483:537-1379(-)
MLPHATEERYALRELSPEVLEAVEGEELAGPSASPDSVRSRKTTMMVQSSTTSSSSAFHRFRDSFTKRLDISCGVSPFWACLCTMAIISSLPMNSVSPSLISMRYLSSALSTTSVISGLEMTPTLAATLSPNERVMHSPGMSRSCSHTRSGPTGLPMCMKEAMRPRNCRILAASEAMVGTWSVLSGTPSVEPPGTTFPMMQRESPTLTTVRRLPSAWMYAMMPVEPERSELTVCRRLRTALHSTQVLEAASLKLPALKASELASILGRRFTMACDTLRPS